MNFLKKNFTIPNLLSIFRLILAFLFLKISMSSGIENNQNILLGILALSALTDFLDGRIARRFHMVSELGKLLDPIADKATQGVLLFSFLYKYEMAKYVLILFLIKECYMGVMGTRTIMLTNKNEGAMWYGKISTAFFYFVMIVLLVFINIPKMAAEMLIVLCGGFMFLALILYARHYRNLRNNVEMHD